MGSQRSWVLSRTDGGFVLIGGPSLKPGESVPVVEAALTGEQEGLVRRAIFDPGRFVPRDMKWGEPRWEGDGHEREPLHHWQTRAVLAALGLRAAGFKEQGGGEG